MGSDFYITLPSNTENDRHGNSSADFRVHLPDTIRLSGDWEVALAEILYVKSWDNFHYRLNQLRFTLANDVNIWVQVPPGHYETIDQLNTAIHHGMQQYVESLVVNKNRSGEKETKEDKQHYLLSTQLSKGVIFTYD